LLHDSTCVQPLVTGWWFRDIGSAHMAFAVAGPMTFNALPDELCDPTINTTTFRRLLKTHFFSSYLHVIRGEDVMRYINPRYLLTYLGNVMLLNITFFYIRCF